MTKACKLGQERMKEAMSMIDNGMELSIAQMADVVHVHEFCELMGKHSDNHTDCRLSDDELTAWVESMCHNLANGTKMQGAKWTEEQTTEVATAYNIEFTHITSKEFWAVMNMVYHDYYKSAVEAGILDVVKFYLSLAKDFMFDDDGKVPHKKIYCYYTYVVK